MKINFMKHCVVFSATILSLLFTSCKPNEGGDPIDPRVGSVFVLNEGNWGVSNSSLSLYDPFTESVTANFFGNANNDALLGDVPTSVTLIENRAYITISNSGKVYVINPTTGILVEKIIDLNSPRHVVYVGDNKIYISNLYSNHIDIYNILTKQIVGKIELPAGAFAEQMVYLDGCIYANCWSYGKQIIKINISTGKVVGSVEVGVQPMTIALDKNNNLWTMTDGGYEGNPTGYENPKLVCLDANLNIVKSIEVPRDPKAVMHKMAMAHLGEYVYFTNSKLYRLSVADNTLPTEAFVDLSSNNVYGLAVDPISKEVYVSDAVDFVQNGTVMRYAKDGRLIHKFQVGINPGNISFVIKH